MSSKLIIVKIFRKKSIYSLASFQRENVKPEKLRLVSLSALTRSLGRSINIPVLSDENRAQVYLAQKFLRSPEEALYPTIRLLQNSENFLPDSLDPFLIPVAQSDKYKKWYSKSLVSYYEKKARPKIVKNNNKELLSLDIACVHQKALQLCAAANLNQYKEAQLKILGSSSQCKVS